MSLQFVLGSSGSGKTEYVYGQIVAQAGEHPKKNYLVIVPEQFTMQTQQKLVELAPNHAIMNIDVLSLKDWHIVYSTRWEEPIFRCSKRLERILCFASWRVSRKKI